MAVVGRRVPWSSEREEYLKDAYLKGASYLEIAEHLSISRDAVEHRRIKLGLPKPSERVLP